MNDPKSVLLRLENDSSLLAILIDPDKVNPKRVEYLCEQINLAKPSMILIGSSLVVKKNFHAITEKICAGTSCPTVLFPGNPSQLNPSVDATLLLSLISGRNPELLIGQHVQSAAKLKALKSEIIPTGYMLIEGGKITSVSYMSGTLPIPHDKNDIAMSTALAGQFLGLKAIYMDAGSGATKSISPKMIRAVSQAISVPLIVGGGLRSVEQIQAAWDAGANMVVIGNALEEDQDFFHEIAMLQHSH